MRTRDFEPLGERHLVPLLSGSTAHGAVTYVPGPIGSIRGFLFERTGHPGGRDFYLWAFVQPMFVEATSFVLTLGERVGSLWTLDPDEHVMRQVVDAARSRGLPFLDGAATNEKLAALLERRLQQEPRALYEREALGGLLALSGDTDGACRALDGVPSIGSDGPAWVGAAIDRMTALSRDLRTDPRAATNGLRQKAQDLAERLGVRVDV